MIYIDPPYNRGTDSIYKDNFSQSMKVYVDNSGQVDDEGNRLVQNTESNGRLHGECKIVCVNRYCMNLLYAPYWGKQR